MDEVRGYYNLKQKILVSLIYAGSFLITTLVVSSFMKFYTDVIGLSPAIYGIVFTIFSIWNGINDPLLGFWADKQEFIEGKGKYKRLIRWSIPVLGVSVTLLLFASPGWNDVLIGIYLLILMVLYEGAQTLLNVSFGAFRVNTFISTEDRTKMQVISNYVIMIPVFIAGMIPAWFLTGDFSRRTIILVYTIAIIVGVIMVIIGSFYVKEDKGFYERTECTQGFNELWTLFKTFIKDKAFRIFVIGLFFMNITTGNYFVGYLYYMDNVLVVDGLKATIPDVLTGLFQLALFPLIVMLAKKFGSRNTLSYGLIISVIGHFILFFPVNYWIASGTYIVILGGYAFYSALWVPMQGLVIDNLELKTGKRQPGVVAGIMSMFLIPALSIQTLILSAMLSISGYDGSMKEQSVEVVQAIRTSVGLIPAIILLMGIVIMLKFPIDKNKEKEIQLLIEEKHKLENNNALS